MYNTETSLTLDEDTVAAVQELRSIRDAIKALQGREADIKAGLLAALADADQGVTASGVPVVEVRRQERSYVDTKKLQALYRDVWKDCQKHSVVSSIRFPAED